MESECRLGDWLTIRCFGVGVSLRVVHPSRANGYVIATSHLQFFSFNLHSTGYIKDLSTVLCKVFYEYD